MKYSVDLKFLDTLMSNIEKYRTVEKEALPHGLSEDELMQVLQKRMEENQHSSNEHNMIVSKHLRPLLNNVKQMESDIVDKLLVFAQSMASADQIVDMGIALEVYQTLISYARYNRDTPRLIRSLSGAGLVYALLHEHTQCINFLEFRERATLFLREGAAFKDQYFELDDRDSRYYVCCCLVNLYVSFFSDNVTDADIANYENYVNSSLKFLTDEKVQALDPDFPWDKMVVSVHYNLCQASFWLRKQSDETRNKKLAQQVYDSYIYLTQHGEVNGGLWPKSKNEYIRISASYCANKICYEEALAEYRVLFNSADTTDYSFDNIFAIMYVSGVLAEHLMLPEHSEKCKQTKQEIKEIVAKLVKYCKHIPSDMNRSLFYKYISLATRYLGNSLDFESYLDMILNLTTYAHLPTCAHSIMTVKLTSILARHFVSRNPEYFIGVCCTKSVHDVLTNTAKILKLISRAALCHDVGKVFYVNIISLSMRRLYEFEYDIIKQHVNPSNLSNSCSKDMQFISDVIEGHHKWYDDTNGYPKNFASMPKPYKFVIDMITIADCIDAATDNVGRSYAQTKTAQQVIDEILLQAGTRYNPIIANALLDKNVREQIENCLAEGRKDAYYRAYKHFYSAEK